MYLQYFGLAEAPFSITPDPAFVYLSAAHRDALAHLLYGVGQGGAGGFVQLTGEVGTGKTTLCRCLLEQVPENTQVALVLNPMMTPRELLATISEELGLETSGTADSGKAMVDALNGYLLAQHAVGRRVVVVIDEAQNLSPEALEQVRLLTNLETAKDKLLQIVLLGQPELRQLLQRQNLRQLSQRITARYHLAPLNRDETVAYISHRMKVAGAQRNPFRKSAMLALYQRSGGIPRLINIIADRSLAAAYARESANVTSKMVHAAANEVQPSERRVRRSRWPTALAAAATVFVLATALWTLDLSLLDRLQFRSADAVAVAPGAQPAQQVPAELELAEQGAAVPAGPDTAVVGELLEPEAETVAPASRMPVEPGPDWMIQQHHEAWQTLAGLWQDEAGADAIRAACGGEARTGYACLAEQGNWSRIRQLGLPVVLVLRNPEDRLLLLRGFSSEGILAGPVEDSRELSRDFLERQWLGEYYVAWPQAPDWPGEIRRGETGKAVDIVLEMATYAEPAWRGGDAFDSGFESWLMTFQRRNGLKPDGIVGPNTLIYLMAPTITRPRLMLPGEESS